MGAYMASHCTYTLSLAAPVESLSPPSAEKNLPLGLGLGLAEGKKTFS